MPQSLSLGLLGFWHVHAPDYAEQVAGLDTATIAVAWDDDEDRGRAGAAELGLAFDPDLDTLLARDDIDGVVITTSTAAHTDVIGRAIAAGKHVFTEKLLAPTVAEAEQLLEAARDAGVSLVVSLPRLTEGLTATIARVLAEGALGDLTYFRVRLAHDGSVAGWLPDRFYAPQEAIGGALADLGCHAVYLTQHLLGPVPEQVTAVYSSITGQSLEDNAVVTLRYPGGVLAVLEASNVTTPGASALEVRGTRGTLVSGFAGRGLLGKGDAFDPETWIDVPTDDDEPLPIAQWVTGILSGTPVGWTAAPAVELTRLVDAANRAAAAGRTLDYSSLSTTSH
ncbi:MAG: putative dehydrogenase [Naasia sp.]|nr:putative dehydrogenase [Naasia sp.]